MAKQKEEPLSMRERLLAGLHTALDKNEDIKFSTADEAEYLCQVKKFVPTGIDGLDLMLSKGKGLPCGRCIELFGKPASGKSALAQYLIGRFVNLYKSPVHYLDFDKSYDQGFMDGYGVTSKDVIIVDGLVLESGWDYLAAAINVLGEMRAEDSNCPPSLVLWDSLAAAETAAEHNAESVEESQVGQVAKAIGKGLRKIRRTMSSSDICCLMVNEIRSVIGARKNQKQTMTPGGWAAQFAYSMRLEISSYEMIKNSKDVPIAQIVKIVSEKNKFAPRKMNTSLVLSYHRGIDAGWSNFMFYRDNGYIESSGTKGFRWGASGKDGETFRRKDFGDWYRANENLVSIARAELFEKTLKAYEEYGDPADRKGKSADEGEEE